MLKYSNSQQTLLKGRIMKIGIIGLGKMGETIVQGLRRSPDAHALSISGTTRSAESAAEASKRLNIECHTDNQKLATASDVILLCVKPHQSEKVLRSISEQLDSRKLLISIVASITTEQLHDWSGKTPAAIIRTMPNTPCLIGEGMTVLCAGPGAEQNHVAKAKQIFETVGKTAVIEESLMDGATGLSGCGPAYIYLIIEALSEAGVKVGLPRKISTLLAAQTLLGASKMVLDRAAHPAALKDEVTTPAGCTIDGLMALEEGKLRVTLIKAVLAAAKRSKTLRG
ncbi:MAG: pyrroline-5-carboxylate reductase [Bdellovibrionales bacterium RIFOXYC1_FULL_54_43]|nr:MAG: pyrroline-5-carboxylate reductase [Bdellovibrionales bacterium RIFOXYC1_FULL_54_43]OFZ85833.1 MAG: pyrroline-5-carboxylate reductase [Bdellovibrionales bacterium RIFOXYD1_FULL_55_31]